LFGLAWGGARWLTVTVLLLAIACTIDWFIDRRQETPWTLRWAMLLVQIVAAAVGVIVLLLPPLLRRLSDSRLALWVEDKAPGLSHRLISAVQLNQPDADTDGMSPELIAVVTLEAEAATVPMSFAALVDPRRLRWSVGLLSPLMLAVAVVLALWPETVVALVERQFLADRDIPRSIHLASETAETVWPAGDEGVLRFRVTGAELPDDLQGQVRVDPEGLPSERYPLTLEARDGTAKATYVARVPASSADFHYHAWLHHSRTRRPAHVHFEPRPVVKKQEAWVLLPGYCGLRPNWRIQAALDGLPLAMGLPRPPVALTALEPFEEFQRGADIVRRLPGSSARVTAEIQKPVVEARLEVLGQSGGAGEKVRREIPLTLTEEGQQAEGLFRLEPGDTAYRIVVRDRHGFANGDPPRRGIRTVPLDPPQVALLPEHFRYAGDTGSLEDYEVEGMPVPLGGKIRIGYFASAPYGLGRGQLRYRVLRGNQPMEAQVPDDEVPWIGLRLTEKLASEATGPFDPQRGLFILSGENDQVEFHAMPSLDPDKVGGKEGGGRFDFQTKGIPDGKGGLLDLKVGDRIEYYVEVFDRVPEADRLPGRSEIRVKNIVSAAEWLAWKREKERQEERLHQLESKQRGVFGGVTLPPEDDLPRVSSTIKFEERRTLPRQTPEGAAVFGRAWQLLGPFPSPDDKGHALVYPPEIEHVMLDKDYDGLKGKMRWKVYHSDGDKIDLEKYFAHGDAGVAYAACWFKCNRKSVVLGTGSDDGIKVWINGLLVVDKPVHREAVPGDDLTPVELADGWNACLVKVDNRYGTWAFYLDLRDPGSGRKLEPVDVRLTPVREETRRFARRWQVLGPFPNPRESGYDKVYPPETEKVTGDKDYDGRDGKIRWKRYESDADKVDFLKALSLRSGDKDGMAYAVCWVQCDRERKAVLATGSDDGLKVWINRQVVLAKHGKREASPGEDQTKINLTAGRNEVLVKVGRGSGPWGFYLELRDPMTGRTLPGISYELKPPKDQEKK
jgi:hypothetical protein